jgi:hypothetical protein
LSTILIDYCGFAYEMSLRESPDGRGLDVALISDPRRVEVTDLGLCQVCSAIVTDVIDAGIVCPEGVYPLFSGPPLLVDVILDGQPISVFVNHFKSKRGGEFETAPRRLAQAQHVLNLVEELLGVDEEAALIVIGDFNDYGDSPAMQTLTSSGSLYHVLALVPAVDRYSYIFDGASQLTDWILVSPSLEHKIISASIAHVNSDYPYQLETQIDQDNLRHRSSDHDVPFVVVELVSEKDQDTITESLPVSTPTGSAFAPTTVNDAAKLPLKPVNTQGERPVDIQESIDRGETPSNDDSVRNRLAGWTAGLAAMVMFVVIVGLWLTRGRYFRQ